MVFSCPFNDLMLSSLVITILQLLKLQVATAATRLNIVCLLGVTMSNVGRIFCGVLRQYFTALDGNLKIAIYCHSL